MQEAQLPAYMVAGCTRAGQNMLPSLVHLGQPSLAGLMTLYTEFSQESTFKSVFVFVIW